MKVKDPLSGLRTPVSLDNSANQFNKLHLDLKQAIGEANRTPVERKIFSFEDFRTMIVNTYNDWYSDISIKWDLNDYLNVIKQSDCLHHFGPYLEVNETNILNINNLPYFDLGDKPTTYNPKKAESEQIFIVPHSVYPDKLVFRYSDCKPLYLLGHIKEKFEKSSLA